MKNKKFFILFLGFYILNVIPLQAKDQKSHGLQFLQFGMRRFLWETV